ncbi:hypothetical protein FHS18_001697 [Paenibacillus phyllosphaerae]|uniref:Uncharacterized protein n=1 Tax=Paenibacillus phyllosphaerae TaxID=274593 RepID=A0A7W5FM54_9BACL|nr:hypothetical protein [Paenibacillus phyllosphaerae]
MILIWISQFYSKLSLIYVAYGVFQKFTTN